jgi:3-oxoacyl-[acyl-carrier protein] reductase
MNGKTALVTGASRGIGAAIAERLRQEGARILAPTRSEMDLLSYASVDAYLDRLAEPVDILVNNAGINILGGIDDIRDRDLLETLQNNLIAPLRLARGIAEGMERRRYGRIVNISSIWSVVSRPRRIAYTMSKAGLNGLTRALAIELAPHNILVNAVAPGYVDTELTRKNNTSLELDVIRKSVPLGRLIDPAEIAEVVAFLCSSRNRCITGQTVIADGGYTCQ